jgi:hypothetical protein
MLSLTLNETDNTVFLREDDRVLISLAKFPVAKLKVQLEQWMSELSDDRPTTFVFVDNGGGLTGALRIEPRPTGWQFTSCFERDRHQELLSLRAVVDLLQSAELRA